MVIVVWEYVARRDRLEDFEAFYRADGPWAELFRGAPGFVSTTLWKDLRDPRRFLVVDRWTSTALYEEFKHERAAAYQELGERGQRLIERETEVGRFGSTE